MVSQEIFELIKEHFEVFEEGHTSGTKAGALRARKALGEVKKLVTEYRKASVDETK